MQAHLHETSCCLNARSLFPVAKILGVSTHKILRKSTSVPLRSLSGNLNKRKIVKYQQKYAFIYHIIEAADKLNDDAGDSSCEVQQCLTAKWIDGL
jgi:hypothetical protein